MGRGALVLNSPREWNWHGEPWMLSPAPREGRAGAIPVSTCLMGMEGSVSLARADMCISHFLVCFVQATGSCGLIIPIPDRLEVLSARHIAAAWSGPALTSCFEERVQEAAGT